MKEKLKISLYCPKCGADNEESFINKEKSNENWKVMSSICPYCGERLKIKVE